MPEICQKSVDTNLKMLWFIIPHIEVIIYAMRFFQRDNMIFKTVEFIAFPHIYIF